jgi:hypothetical protein
VFPQYAAAEKPQTVCLHPPKAAILKIGPVLLGAVFRLVGLAASPVAAEHVASEDVHAELIRRYLEGIAAQDAGRKCVEVEMTIQAKLAKLNREAVLRALRSTSPTGRVSYRELDASGDSLVRREVIARYLTAESQAQEMSGIAVTPANYTFRFVRIVEQAGRRVHVFQLNPMRKRLGLFKGELWLDGQTGLLLHQSGQLVSNPSIFVKRITFAHEFQIQNGMAIPDRFAVTVETRLAGRADLSIQFSNFGYRETQGSTDEPDGKCQ